MNSSEMALAIRVAMIGVAAMLFTAAQLRVLAGSPPRRTRYIVAWLVSAVILAALGTYLDSLVGRAGMSERAQGLFFAAAAAAIALTAGHRLSQSPFWMTAGRGRRVTLLLALNALIVWLLDGALR